MTNCTITISQAALAKALNHIARVVEKRNSIPVLGHLLLKAEGQTLHITGTDLDMLATTSLPCTAQIPAGTAASFTVEASLMTDIVRKLSGNSDITLGYNGDSRVSLKSGRSSFNLVSFPPEDFPDFSMGELPTRLQVNKAVLETLLSKTAFAISNEETRYYLKGAYLHTTDRPEVGACLSATATDGHRLSLVELQQDEDFDNTWPGIIIPAKAVQEMLRQLKDHDGPVPLKLSPHLLQASFDATTFTTKLVDGTFPDYRRILPREQKNHASLDRELLLQAVARVLIVAANNKHTVRLLFTSETLTLTYKHEGGGDTAQEEMACEYTGQPLEVGVNGTYLTQILSTLDSATIHIGLNEPRSPLTIRNAGDGNTQPLIVLMPCSL